jgi:hypothetical protein
LKIKGNISSFRYGLNESVIGKYRSSEKTGFIGLDSESTSYQRIFNDQVAKGHYFEFNFSPNSGNFDPDPKSLTIVNVHVFRNNQVCGKHVQKILNRQLYDVTTQGKKPFVFRFTCR